MVLFVFFMRSIEKSKCSKIMRSLSVGKSWRERGGGKKERVREYVRESAVACPHRYPLRIRRHSLAFSLSHFFFFLFFSLSLSLLLLHVLIGTLFAYSILFRDQFQHLLSVCGVRAYMCV